MPCLIALLALAFPRIAVFLVWMFTADYFSRAFGSAVIPFLGFLFLPLTTLTYAYAHNSLGDPGSVSALGWILTAIALVVDLGLMRGGHTHYRRRRLR